MALRKPPTGLSAAWGILIIDATLAAVAATLLIKINRRRIMEVTTLGNISEALGLTVEGQFLKNRKIMEPPRARPALWLYLIAVGTSVIGIALIIFPGLTSAWS